MALDLSTLVTGLIFVAAFASLVAVGFPLLQRDRASSRLKSVTDRRQQLSAQQRAELQQQRVRRKPQRHVELMKTLLTRFKLDEMLKAKELRARLSQAGLRSSSAPVTYVTARILAPLVLLGIAFVYLTGVFPKLATGQKFAIYAGIAALGFYLPQLWLSNKIQKRQQVLTRSFPDSLDLMVICVEAGLSLEGAFSRVTEEVAESAPEMAEEIGLTAAELAFLGDRRQAYDNFAERTGLPAVKSLATTLIQAERYGTSIAVGLRVLSQENRDARLAAAEKKAAALPAKLTVPMIVFFLPVLFLVIAGPAAIQIATR